MQKLLLFLAALCMSAGLNIVRAGETAQTQSPAAAEKGHGFTAGNVVPASTLAFIEFKKPGAVIQELGSSITKLSAAAHGDNEYERTRSQMKAQLGFDIGSEASLTDAGFDLSKALFVMLVPTDKDGEAALVFSVGAVDGKKVIAAFKAAVGKELPVRDVPGDAGTPHITILGTMAAFAEAHGRVYMAAVPLGSDPALDVKLKSFFAQQKKGLLRDDASFKTEAANLKLSDPAELLIYSKGIPSLMSGGARSSSPGEASPTSEIADILILANHAGVEANVFLKHADVLSVLRSGDPNRDFIARLEKPLALCTLNVSDPIALLLQCLKLEMKEKEAAALSANLEQDLGVSLADLSATLKSAAGVAIYPRPQSGGEPTALFFLKSADSAKAGKLLEQLAQKHPELKQTKYGDAQFYSTDKDPIVIGMLGDYVVGGSALPQIQRLATGKIETPIGTNAAEPLGTMPAAAQLFLDVITNEFTKGLPPDVAKAWAAAVPDTAQTTLKMTRLEQGINLELSTKNVDWLTVIGLAFSGALEKPAKSDAPAAAPAKPHAGKHDKK